MTIENINNSEAVASFDNQLDKIKGCKNYRSYKELFIRLSDDYRSDNLNRSELVVNLIKMSDSASNEISDITKMKDRKKMTTFQNDINDLLNALINEELSLSVPSYRK